MRCKGIDYRYSVGAGEDARAGGEEVDQILATAQFKESLGWAKVELLSGLGQVAADEAPSGLGSIVRIYYARHAGVSAYNELRPFQIPGSKSQNLEGPIC